MFPVGKRARRFYLLRAPRSSNKVKTDVRGVYNVYVVRTVAGTVARAAVVTGRVGRQMSREPAAVTPRPGVVVL